MDNKKKLLLGGGAILGLLLLASTSHADENKKLPDNKPPDNGKKKGPFPPPWPGKKIGTVRVEGTNPKTGQPYRGMLVRTAPSLKAAQNAQDPEVFNGQKVAILGEQMDDTKRTWVEVYTPNGYPGWISSLDPQGVRNVWYDDLADRDQRPKPDLEVGGAAMPIPDSISGAPPQHGWYPYQTPARVAPAVQRNVQHVAMPAGRYPFR